MIMFYKISSTVIYVFFTILDPHKIDASAKLFSFDSFFHRQRHQVKRKLYIYCIKKKNWEVENEN